MTAAHRYQRVKGQLATSGALCTGTPWLKQILVTWVRTRRDIQKLGFMKVMKEGGGGGDYCYVNMSHLSSLAFSTTPLAILESDGIYRDGISFFHPLIPRVCSYW